jgi:hypothetical protein
MYGIAYFLAFIFTLLGFYTYFLAMKNDAANTNLATWSLWTLVGLIVMLSKIFSYTDPMELYHGIVLFIGPLCVSLLMMSKGSKWSKTTYFDKVCTVIALILLLIYCTSELTSLKNDNEFEKILTVLVILLDLVIFLPLLVEIYKNPQLEKLYPCALLSIGNMFALASIENRTFVGSGFIIYLTVIVTILSIYLFSQ